jgi:hypothetical protein
LKKKKLLKFYNVKLRWVSIISVFYHAVRSLDSIASNGRIAIEKLIGKYMKGTGCGLI